MVSLPKVDLQAASSIKLEVAQLYIEEDEIFRSLTTDAVTIFFGVSQDVKTNCESQRLSVKGDERLYVFHAPFEVHLDNKNDCVKFYLIKETSFDGTRVDIAKGRIGLSSLTTRKVQTVPISDIHQGRVFGYLDVVVG